MRVKLILPALTEATSPFLRPIKYTLFPPLGLATLAAYLDPDDDVAIVDEHVQTLHLDDDPDLVVIQVYITNAYRAYASPTTTGRAARVSSSAGSTSRRCRRRPPPTPTRSSSVPGEHTFPEFLRDLAAGRPKPRYESARPLARIDCRRSAAT